MSDDPVHDANIYMTAQAEAIEDYNDQYMSAVDDFLGQMRLRNAKADVPFTDEVTDWVPGFRPALSCKRPQQTHELMLEAIDCKGGPEQHELYQLVLDAAYSDNTEALQRNALSLIVRMASGYAYNQVG